MSYQRKPWSKEEIETLKENYQLSANELCKLLPQRSKNSIYGKRKSLGLLVTSRITDEQLEFIKTNYKEMSAAEMAEKIGANKEAIKYRLKSMGLTRLTYEWEVADINTSLVDGKFLISYEYEMR